MFPETEATEDDPNMVDQTPPVGAAPQPLETTRSNSSSAAYEVAVTVTDLVTVVEAPMLSVAVSVTS